MIIESNRRKTCDNRSSTIQNICRNVPSGLKYVDHVFNAKAINAHLVSNVLSFEIDNFRFYETKTAEIDKLQNFKIF